MLLYKKEKNLTYISLIINKDMYQMIIYVIKNLQRLSIYNNCRMYKNVEI